jgi:hypothetical protein
VVLVIIGLIVGGVLVGQDLVRAAGERAQITQIEKFNTAANTFFGKYGYLPGDIPAAAAAQFGLAARGPYAGQGDGNGLLEGNTGAGPGTHYTITIGAGETAMFWNDLSSAGLIEGSFFLPSSTAMPTSNVTGNAINGYLPAAKIGGTNYVYVYGSPQGCGLTQSYPNMFGLSAISNISASSPVPYSSPGLTVKQAYDIDSKVDDGNPVSGRVVTLYLDEATFGACGAGVPSNCYVNSGSYPYAITQNGGSNVSCALSFKIQAGD